MMNEGKKEKREKKQKRLRRWIAFDVSECKGAEEYLQEMAEKGWLLDEIKGGTYYFVPIEPRKLRYAVKVFDGASAYDLSPSETSLTYAEYCEKAGWHFVGSLGKIHFFYEEQPGAVDIETDAKLELKAVMKYAFIQSILILILFPILLFSSLINFSFLRLVTSYGSIVSAGMLFIIFLLALFKLVHFMLWFFQNKRRVDRGERILYRGRASLRWNLLFLVLLFMLLLLGLLVIGLCGGKLFAILMLAFMLALIGFTIGVIAILRKIKISGTLNFVICLASGFGFGMALLMVVVICFIFMDIYTTKGIVYSKSFPDGTNLTLTAYKDDVPITTDDLGITAKGVLSNEKHISETNFAADINYDSSYEFFDQENEASVGISYEIFTSPYKWIMGKYQNEKLYHSYLDFPKNWVETDAGIWNAKTVYCRRDNVGAGNSETDVRYVVFYANAVLDFTADKNDLSQKDIKLICDKLHQEISAIPASGAN